MVGQARLAPALQPAELDFRLLQRLARHGVALHKHPLAVEPQALEGDLLVEIEAMALHALEESPC